MGKQDGGPLVSEPLHTHAHRASFTKLRDMETKILNDVAEKEMLILQKKFKLVGCWQKWPMIKGE